MSNAKDSKGAKDSKDSKKKAAGAKKPKAKTGAEAGKARRTQVMGEAFVERAMGSMDGFTRPLQEWLNEHAWGSTWLRDGLDLKTRSLCTCSMLAALGRSTELKGHVRGAINNGASVVEIREVLLHCAIYAGAPAASEAFRAAKEVLAEMGVELPE